MTRSKSAALALSLAALCLVPASRADESSGEGDVQAHPKELTGPGTKGSKLKVDPKNNPAAGQKVDPAQAKAAKAATAAPKETKAAPEAATKAEPEKQK